MLKIWVNGFQEDCIKDIDNYFKEVFNESWLSDEMVTKILIEVDSVEVKENQLYSKVFGILDIDRLPSSCKALILMHKLENSNVYASRCSNDCANLILEIANSKDLTITLHTLMEFKQDFKGVFLDTNEVFENRQQYVVGMCKLLRVL